MTTKNTPISLVYNMNCVAGMKEYPDKYFDLLVADPPYGINFNMNAGLKKGEKRRYKDKEWDKGIPNFEAFLQMFRVSKNQIIWGGNYFTEHLPPTKAWIFWDKHTADGMSFADGELAWTSFNKTLVKVSLPYSGFVGRESSRFHPTQKPVKLYEWIFRNYLTGGGGE